MSRKRRKRESQEAEFHIPDDIEKQIVFTVPFAPAVHDTIRQRYRGRLWWIVVGFESEPAVGEIFTEIEEAVTSPAGVERIVFPIIRAGERTGMHNDKLLMLFAKKTAVGAATISAKCNKYGTAPMVGARDCLAISRGYVVALYNLLHELTRGTHRDN